MNLVQLPADILHLIAKLINPRENDEENPNLSDESDTGEMDSKRSEEIKWYNKSKAIRNIVNLSKVNKRLYQVLNIETLWKHFYQRDLSDTIPDKNIKRRYYEIVAELSRTHEEELDYYLEVVNHGCEKIIYEMDDKNIRDELVLAAVSGKNDDIFFYLYDIFEKNQKRISLTYSNGEELYEAFKEDLICKIVKIGAIRLLEKLEQKGFIYDGESAISQAIISDNLEMIKYLESKRLLTPSLLVHVKSLKVLEYLASKIKLEENYVDLAIGECKNFSVFRYLWPYSSMKLFLLDNILTHQLDTRNFSNVKYLIKLGLDLEAICCYGTVRQVKYFLKHGSSITKKCLENAILCRNKPVIEYLLKKNPSLSGPYPSIIKKIDRNEEYCNYIKTLMKKYR